MIDKTQAEARAIKAARRPLYAALQEHGLDRAFNNATAEQMDAVIEACVTGFQQGLKSELLDDEIPF